MKFIKIIAIAAVFTILFTACGEKSVDREKKISVSEKNIVMEIDETVSIKAEILSERYEDGIIIFISSDESVAKVDSNGKITPVSEGDCAISSVLTSQGVTPQNYDMGQHTNNIINGFAVETKVKIKKDSDKSKNIIDWENADLDSAGTKNN